MASQQQHYLDEEDEEDAFDAGMDFGIQQAGYEPGQYNEAESGKPPALYSERTLRSLEQLSGCLTRGRTGGPLGGRILSRAGGANAARGGGVFHRGNARG